MNLGLFYYKILIDKILNNEKYKKYLENFDKKLALNLEDIDKKNKNKFYEELLNYENISILEEEFNYRGYEKQEFTLEVKGKGVFIGLGYTHEIPAVKGQLINGFYFDYSTGKPIIPGSSIKGVIRSGFPYTDKELQEKISNQIKNKEDKAKDIKFLYEEINKGKLETIKEILKELGFNLNEEDIFKLRDEIFEYGDIFLDAYIISRGKIFDIDYFAPHDDEFSHPVPLKFLKITQGVKFKFRFLVKDGILTANQKKSLLKKIILVNGLGAKVNENYGRFKNIRKSRRSRKK